MNVNEGKKPGGSAEAAAGLQKRFSEKRGSVERLQRTRGLSAVATGHQFELDLLAFAQFL